LKLETFIFKIIFFSIESLQGSEFAALVFFGNNLDGMLNNEIFSRCISNLILVIKEDVASSLSLDPQRSRIIPIFGLYFAIFLVRLIDQNISF
jgi:hypothetical protein